MVFGRSGFDSRSLQSLRASNFEGFLPAGSKTSFFFKLESGGMQAMPRRRQEGDSSVGGWVRVPRERRGRKWRVEPVHLDGACSMYVLCYVVTI